MLVVLVLSTFWNLVYAVGIGLVIASLMFMKKIGDLTSKESDVVPLADETWTDEFDFPEGLKEEVFIKHINGPLFFGSTSDFQQLAKQIPATAHSVIIRMNRVPYMDQSGLYAMEEVLTGLVNSGKVVLLVGIQQQPKLMLKRINLIPDLIPAGHVFDDFRECLVWIKESVQDNV